MTIHVHKIIGSNAGLNSEQGKCIREHYGESWKQEGLVFDFAGVIRVSPSFLSQALLPLLFDGSPQYIAQKVSFLNKPPAFDYAWENVLKAVAERVRKSTS